MQEVPLLLFDEQYLLALMKDTQAFHAKEFAIIFIKKGKADFLVNGQLHHYTSNSILFISPKNIYEMKSISATVEIFIAVLLPDSKNFFNYNFNRFNVYQALKAGDNNSVPLPKSDFNSVWGVLQHIHHTIHQKIKTTYQKEIIKYSFSAVAYSIVSFLEAQFKSNTPTLPVNSRKEFISVRFLELAAQHYLKERELKFYAEKLFISIKYLSICVKEITGNTPTFFLQQLLVEEACKRLMIYENSIANIAFDLGFADQFIFSKFFKKTLQQTPSQFRKRAGQVHTI